MTYSVVVILVDDAGHEYDRREVYWSLDLDQAVFIFETVSEEAGT